MTEKEAFRIGFLLQCADEGLTPVETRERMIKAALLKSGMLEEGMLKSAGGFWDWLGSLVQTGGHLIGKAAEPVIGAGKTALIVGPPALGAGGGYLLSQLNQDAYSEEDAKTDEELAEMYRAISQLEQSERRRRAAA